MTNAASDIELPITFEAQESSGSSLPSRAPDRTTGTTTMADWWRARAVLQAPVRSACAARTEFRAAAAVAELRRYLTFPHGWDGYDGAVPDAATVGRAIEMVAALVESFLVAASEPSEIAPCPIGDGRIDIEVRVADRHLIATVEPHSDDVNVFYREHGETHEVLARWHQANLDRWIQRVTGESRLSVAVRPSSSDSRIGNSVAFHSEAAA